MTAKHTVTPYVAEQMDDPRWAIVSGNTIVACTVSENDKANAEFIVRACNAHDELVEACKFAKAQIKRGAGKKALPILRAVIAKAKGE